MEASLIGPVIDAVNQTFPQTGIRLDSAVVPNTFKGIAPNTFLDSNETFLTLDDGGEDGEVVPIQPLLVKARGLDVIVAIDAVSFTSLRFCPISLEDRNANTAVIPTQSADTADNFADGSSLIVRFSNRLVVPSMKLLTRKNITFS